MIISTFYDHLKAASDETGLSIEKIGEMCLEIGISAYEATERQIFSDDIKKLKGAGMRINSMPVHCDLLHNPSLDYAKQIVESAVEAGAETILVIPGNFTVNDDRSKVLEASLEPIDYIINAAGHEGIAVGMEDFDGNMSANLGLAGVKWYLDRLPGLTCIFDTGNFIYAGEDVLQNYKELKPFITKQVHCKDRGLSGREGEKPLVCLNGEKLYPAAAGKGIIPIGKIVGDLAESGFDGSLTVEVYGSAKPWKDIAESAEYLRYVISKFHI